MTRTNDDWDGVDRVPPDDAHYAKLAVQPKDAVRAWSVHWPSTIAYELGEAVRMIARAGTKGQMVRDLKKARWLLDEAVRELEP
jgi:hypothetical protein